MLFGWLTWRFWSCPTTMEAAARDFLDRNDSAAFRAILAAPDSWEAYQHISYPRQVAACYGLASSFNVQTGEVWTPG